MGNNLSFFFHLFPQNFIPLLWNICTCKKAIELCCYDAQNNIDFGFLGVMFELLAQWTNFHLTFSPNNLDQVELGLQIALCARGALNSIVRSLWPC